MTSRLEQSGHALAGRKPIEDVAAEANALPDLPTLVAMLDAFPGATALLNAERQICLANDKLARLVGRTAQELVGWRPGEVLGCENATREAAGCGTSRDCQWCGALRAILANQRRDVPASEECRLVTGSGASRECLDLRVWTTPLELGGGRYTVLAVQDITDEKRRGVLERIFFHDLLNVAGGLSGLLETWPEAADDEAADLRQLARDLSAQLVEQIRVQRDLVSAERGDLRVRRHEVDVGGLLARLQARYARNRTASGKHIVWPTVVGRTVLHSDETLLGRVLVNLVDNALEASRAGDTVSVGVACEEANVVFRVHNPAAMPESVQRQLFHRSFTTKSGQGHGLGTYSVRLLTERYLGGRVSFRSCAQDGTTFEIRLPAGA